MLSGLDLSPVSHPPHLNKDDWNSALIPVCAYKTNLNISRNRLALPGITFPLCSSFLPTILEGQLCYKLTLNTISGQGKTNELMLLLDYNEDRSLQKSSTEGEVDDSSVGNILNFGTSLASNQDSKVKIDILSHIIGFGGGTYKMTDVKRMTATDDFLNMPLEDRHCQVELYEDCRTRRLLDRCKCVPREFPGYQVKRIKRLKLAKTNH